MAEVKIPEKATEVKTTPSEKTAKDLEDLDEMIDSRLDMLEDMDNEHDGYEEKIKYSVHEIMELIPRNILDGIPDAMTTFFIMDERDIVNTALLKIGEVLTKIDRKQHTEESIYIDFGFRITTGAIKKIRAALMQKSFRVEYKKLCKPPYIDPSCLRVFTLDALPQLWTL